jgi:hypothetical protein
MPPITFLPPVQGAGHSDRALTESEARQIAAELLCPLELDDKRVLVIVPDATRTAPVGMMFRLVHELVGERVAKMDVMIALGTHQPMSDEAINAGWRFRRRSAARVTQQLTCITTRGTMPRNCGTSAIFRVRKS